VIDYTQETQKETQESIQQKKKYNSITKAKGEIYHYTKETSKIIIYAMVAPSI
jgi:hypothetical protein